jgi:hypothetical protein
LSHLFAALTIEMKSFKNNKTNLSFSKYFLLKKYHLKILEGGSSLEAKKVLFCP